MGCDSRLREREGITCMVFMFVEAVELPLDRRDSRMITLFTDTYTQFRVSVRYAADIYT